MKDYIEPRMDVIALEYQNLIASSIDQNDPINPAKSRDWETLESFETF
jgi:hypothetical protein